MNASKVLILGATGFIGRNLLEFYMNKPSVEIYATWHVTEVEEKLKRNKKINWLHADLNQADDVKRVMMGKDIVIQAAATTSGAQTIVHTPHHHVTDNAVMNSLILRQCYELRTKHLIFFSCTTMYRSSTKAVKEEDFNGDIEEKYFGIGWTKIYLEKMCEFYSRLGETKYSVIRHSNIYGPYDKYDLEKSHVFGATVAKVMKAKNAPVVVWGDGLDERDLLHVDDLVTFVDLLISKQNQMFELFNLSSGETVSVKDLVKRVVDAAGSKSKIEYDSSKPSIGFKLSVDSSKARNQYGWQPEIKFG
jgi:GDP-L-fucose synthase